MRCVADIAAGTMRQYQDRWPSGTLSSHFNMDIYTEVRPRWG